MLWWWSLFPLLMSGAVWLGHKESVARLRGWQETVRLWGLTLEESSGPWAAYLKFKARSGPLEARIKILRNGIRVVITVQGPPGFAGVRIRREIFKPSRAREIEVGDQAFDSTFFVEGPIRLVYTLFDVQTRSLLLSINDGSRMEVSGSEIRSEIGYGQVPLIVPLLLELGRRFAECDDVAQRIAGNARQDPAAGVRLQNLLLLAREFPGEPATLEALRAACSDASPQIRLRAAKELRAEGRDVLLEIAESSEEDVWSAQAVAALDQELPFEHATAILANCLRRRRIETARACLEVLGRSSSAAAAVDMLVKVMERERGELAAVAASALGAAGDAAAEPPLIEALQRETKGLRVAAANALGRVGTAAAVLPLKDAAEGSSDPDLLRATRQAIAGIQSRAEGASPGQLSLAGSEVGQLSLAQAETGQLSLATDADGQLSLPQGERG